MLQLLVSIILVCTFVSSAARAETNSASRLQSAFRKDPLWAAGDAVYSIDLGNKRILWLFGDSFIGTIRGGKRIDNEMVHNAVGLQDGFDSNLKFYWNKDSKGKASSFFADDIKTGAWLWPGDGININGRVAFFAKSAVAKPGAKDDGFGFIWKSDELVVVDNPQENPKNWKCRRKLLTFANDFHPGIACLYHEKMLYAFGIEEKTKKIFLLRVPESCLSNLNALRFEFYCGEKSRKSCWSQTQKSAVPLWEQGAAEGSLSRIPGGYLCLYHRNGWGAEIVGRTASKLEGPWSKEKLLYTVPQSDTKRGMCYAGKGHPEQPAASGKIIISYSVNPGPIEAHAKDPESYFPRFVEVDLPIVESNPTH